MPAKLLRNARTKTSLSYPYSFNVPRLCLRCQLRGLETRSSALIESFQSSTSHGARIGKPFSTTSDTGNGRINHKGSVDESQSGAKPGLVDTGSLVTARKYIDDNTSKDKQHSRLPKQLSLILAELTAKAIFVGQKANSLTGTDYSAIEALRKTIKEQEQVVTSQHKAVFQAREAVDAAHTQQAASQKEVVGLLERKSSWSAADLERYMALIRSEHSNELAVQAAKESLNEAERALEEARSQLEKKERAQYHEEQIWSDTIRRNSTWVTIGLMGVNMLILLSSVIVIEPWRRRNMVKEFRAVLDQQLTQQGLNNGNGIVATDRFLLNPVAENADGGANSERLFEEQGVSTTTLSAVEESTSSHEPPKVEELSHTSEASVEENELKSEASGSLVTKITDMERSIAKTFTRSKDFFHESFSDKQITIRQNELTKATLQGASVGAALIAIMFNFLRSK